MASNSSASNNQNAHRGSGAFARKQALQGQTNSQGPNVVERSHHTHRQSISSVREQAKQDRQANIETKQSAQPYQQTTSANIVGVSHQRKKTQIKNEETRQVFKEGGQIVHKGKVKVDPLSTVNPDFLKGVYAAFALRNINPDSINRTKVSDLADILNISTKDAAKARRELHKEYQDFYYNLGRNSRNPHLMDNRNVEDPAGLTAHDIVAINKNIPELSYDVRGINRVFDLPSGSGMPTNNYWDNLTLKEQRAVLKNTTFATNLFNKDTGKLQFNPEFLALLPPEASTQAPPSDIAAAARYEAETAPAIAAAVVAKAAATAAADAQNASENIPGSSSGGGDADDEQMSLERQADEIPQDQTEQDLTNQAAAQATSNANIGKSGIQKYAPTAPTSPSDTSPSEQESGVSSGSDLAKQQLEKLHDVDKSTTRLSDKEREQAYGLTRSSSSASRIRERDNLAPNPYMEQYAPIDHPISSGGDEMSSYDDGGGSQLEPYGESHGDISEVQDFSAPPSISTPQSSPSPIANHLSGVLSAQPVSQNPPSPIATNLSGVLSAPPTPQNPPSPIANHLSGVLSKPPTTRGSAPSGRNKSLDGGNQVDRPEAEESSNDGFESSGQDEGGGGGGGRGGKKKSLRERYRSGKRNLKRGKKAAKTIKKTAKKAAKAAKKIAKRAAKAAKAAGKAVGKLLLKLIPYIVKALIWLGKALIAAVKAIIAGVKALLALGPVGWAILAVIIVGGATAAVVNLTPTSDLAESFDAGGMGGGDAGIEMQTCLNISKTVVPTNIDEDAADLTNPMPITYHYTISLAPHCSLVTFNGICTDIETIHCGDAAEEANTCPDPNFTDSSFGAWTNHRRDISHVICPLILEALQGIASENPDIEDEVDEAPLPSLQGLSLARGGTTTISFTVDSDTPPGNHFRQDNTLTLGFNQLLISDDLEASFNPETMCNDFEDLPEGVSEAIATNLDFYQDLHALLANNSLSWEAAAEVATTEGLSSLLMQSHTRDEFTNNIGAQIEQGRAVLVLLGPDSIEPDRRIWTSDTSGHYILLVGAANSGEVFFIDSSNRSNSLCRATISGVVGEVMHGNTNTSLAFQGLAIW
ncbi:MAG: hypothetical protein LBG64_00050 [Pseudomonadales bacterium]|jgi:hypothetical protein|nr:hypothetical protein [Pseudomonadales bacterium]